jgi:uncharacterized surface protein with fasciclin (FAS1) repeats
MMFPVKKIALAALLAARVVLPDHAFAADQNIVETAVAAGQFKTLAKALDAAGLVATLEGPGPFTVFAPTDDAFAKLPADALQNLLKPENKGELVAILTYHVVPGRLMASDVAKAHELKTVEGKPLEVKAADGAVMIDDAKVTATDITASNGVIHVIDHVVLPPSQ